MTLDSDKIARLRAEHGYTQRSLGEASDIPYSTINRIEKGIITQLRSEALLRLADALGVTPNEILLDLDKRRSPAQKKTMQLTVDANRFLPNGLEENGFHLFSYISPPDELSELIEELTPKQKEQLVRYIKYVLLAPPMKQATTSDKSSEDL